MNYAFETELINKLKYLRLISVCSVELPCNLIFHLSILYQKQFYQKL